MLLAKKNHTLADDRRWTVDYSLFLAQGVRIASVALSVSAGATATAGTATVSDDKRKVFFFTHGGALNETFTVTVVVTLTNSEVIHDTVDFVVVPA